MSFHREQNINYCDVLYMFNCERTEGMMKDQQEKKIYVKIIIKFKLKPLHFPIS